MLSFVKERKAAAAVSMLVPTVQSAVTAAPPVERAAALILANVLLVAGSKAWGREIYSMPTRMNRETAIEALCLMADQHIRLENTANALNGRPASDPALAAFRWEVMANEVVTITIGMAISPEIRPAVYGSWKSLWAARRASDDAVRAMLHYARSYSVEPTPRIGGKRPDAAALRRFGRTLPPMFRKPKR